MRDRSGGTPEVTLLDESYGHQMVSPRHRTEHQHPNWQERCYHLLCTDSGLMLDAGRAVWSEAGLKRAFAGVTDGLTEYCLRTEEPFVTGDDPDRPDVGGISIGTVKPLERIELSMNEPGHAVSFELTYTARFPPVATTPLRVEQRGEVVTHYMNFFQSGRYDGWIDFEGERHQVTDRLGFRDRGWGLRKHEGAPRRGLVLSAFCELPEESVYLLLFETASGKRILSDGWVINEDGVTEAISIEHELQFDGVILTSGTVSVEMPSGQRREISLKTNNHLFLAGVGYSTEPELTSPGKAKFDVTDLEVRARLEGQTDHFCSFVVDGIEGHGYVETGLGIHARYRPEATL